MFDIFYSGNKPNLFAFEQPAISLDDAASKAKTKYFWFIYSNNDYTGFNFDYTPVPWEHDHTHVWPNQWNEFGGAILASVDHYKDRKWHHHSDIIKTKPTSENWITLHPVKEFDYSWAPHPFDPAYIYVFGNQWHNPERMPTVEYHVPGATERKYMHNIRATLAETTENWRVNADTQIKFDFSWCPDPFDPAFIYVFGNQYWEGQRSATVEYHVPGATERKFVEDIQAELDDLEIFFIDRYNPLVDTRINELRTQGLEVTRIRYVHNMMDTIKRICANKSSTSLFWVISSENDYTEFNFKWQPEPWQRSMTHVFGSKWNKWTDTFLINKNEFIRHAEWAKGLEEFPNLNFVDNQLVKTADDSSAMFYVDHGNGGQYDALIEKYPNMRKTRFVDNYLDTFKRIMEVSTTENVWIISSLCDYCVFDFTWQPGAWEREQIHCFTNSHFEKRGDTFYINVESFKAQMHELAMLDWFNVISYRDQPLVERLPMPIVEYVGDNLVEVIKNYEFTSPYAVFTNKSDISPVVNDCVWTERDRVVRTMSASNAITVVPRDIKKYLKTQIYDYPHLVKSAYQYYASDALDIVYISNGEPDAEIYYEHLKTLLDAEGTASGYKRFYNKLKRVQNVNGRVAAYQAAANASDTHWFFAVFAKLEVDEDFNFYWQPDYWQEPKHYIFNARNPVNGLEYGHMGIIAYNKRLVLENKNPGIDFTLSQEHESVPILSGTAHFNQDPWTTWRTAFREVLKLRMFMESNPTPETEHRLHEWQHTAVGDFGNYSKYGARDAMNYYDEVKGDPALLQLSFEWDWLRQRFNSLYKTS
jgi:hypothetical protein